MTNPLSRLCLSCLWLAAAAAAIAASPVAAHNLKEDDVPVFATLVACCFFFGLGIGAFIYKCCFDRVVVEQAVEFERRASSLSMMHLYNGIN